MSSSLDDGSIPTWCWGLLVAFAIRVFFFTKKEKPMSNEELRIRRERMVLAAADRQLKAAKTPQASPTRVVNRETRPARRASSGAKARANAMEKKPKVQRIPEKKVALTPTKQGREKQREKELPVTKDKREKPPTTPEPYNAKDQRVQPTKPTSEAKRKKRLSPLLLLCRSLSEIMDCHVATDESKASSASPTRKQYKNPPLVLNLSLQQQQEPLDWEVVTSALESFLSLTEESTILVNAMMTTTNEGFSNNATLEPCIRRAVVWYSKCETIRRVGLPTIAVVDDDMKELTGALGLFSNFIVTQVVEWIHPHVTKSNLNEEDNDLVTNSLFADDYNPTGNSNQRSAVLTRTNPLDQFLNLLEEPNLVVTKDFLTTMFDAYRLKKERSHDLPTVVLKCLLDRLSRCCFYRRRTTRSNKAPASSELHGKITALAVAINLSPEMCQCLAAHIQQEVKARQGNENNLTGLEVEEASWVRPILSMSAYVIPEPGDDVPQRSPHQQEDASYLFLQQLLLHVPKFPVGALGNKHGRKARQVMDDSQKLMRASQMLTESILRKMFATMEKQVVFDWLLHVISANDALVHMIQGDLLAPTGSIASISSSRSFLLGLTSSFACLTTQGLVERFEKVGINAFDERYLRSDQDDDNKTGLVIPEEERRLLTDAIQRDRSQRQSQDVKFSGSTHLFFIFSALLRVSLFPVLRVQRELHQRDNKMLVQLQTMAQSSASNDAEVPPSILAYSPNLAAYFGFNTFLDEPDFVRNVTNMSLLQLEWLISLATAGSPNEHATSSTMKSQSVKKLESVPEWMCKLPAIWLEHVAQRTPRLLKPHQAEKAVQCAAQLLYLGTSRGEYGEARFMFSPLVIAQLIRIAAAFVNAGVSRAARRNKSRRRRRRRRRFGNISDEESDEDDLRNLDVYLSFDQNDLGVTVFTNCFVCTQLCPTLMETFSSLDVVEGLDVDKEFHFDKFGVRGEISDLLLRLWCHPNGECRTNAVNQLRQGDTVELVENFASSVADSLGVAIGFACHRLSDVCALSRKRRMSRRDMAVYTMEADTTSGLLGMMRRLLLLLCNLSRESTFSAAFCGLLSDTSNKRRSCVSLATMIIHYIDKLTGSDGGTHEDLDFRKEKRPTSYFASRKETMAEEEKKRKRAEIVEARALSVVEFGLDVSLFSHQLLALAARWHLESIETSSFLIAVASIDDCDVDHLRNVFNRLILSQSASQFDVFHQDGFVDPAILHQSYSRVKSTTEAKARRSRARQDVMSHNDLDVVATADDISAFLDALERFMATKSTTTPVLSKEDVEKVEREIITGTISSDEDYGSCLSEWTVSSESFERQSGDATFSHFYDTAARGRATAGSGKILVKEAKRIHRTLPTPHPNSAAFVCFAEERMDLCRGVITGPVDSPYAHGFFSFDVFYPPGYPQVPPLVTFMTTGGGQTRFNPNLYQDGKVCLSLLGTFHAADDSQRWNPRLSSLGQVLLSVQTQLFVEEPYYNEPGYEAKRGTPVGDEACRKYNIELRLATLRHAIIAQLRNPPLGFEEVSHRHFSLCRQRILIQAKLWTLEARTTPTYKRFQRAYGELLGLLSTEELKKYDPLPPMEGDVSALERLDPWFCTKFHLARKPAKRKEAPSESLQALLPSSPQDVLFATARISSSRESNQENDTDLSENPWASPPSNPYVQNIVSASDASTGSDDDLYE